MCGIVGYIGSGEATDFLVQGLRRLEYRGYDSSGVAVTTVAGIEVVKTAGRIDDPNVRWKGVSASATHAGPPTGRRPTRTPIRISAAMAMLPWSTTA